MTDYTDDVADLRERLAAECEGERVAVVVGALGQMLTDRDPWHWLEHIYSEEQRSGIAPPAGKGEEWGGQ